MSVFSANWNPHLTTFAQGFAREVSNDLAEFLAPTVQVPATSGQYKRFDDLNQMRAYPTERGLGQKRAEIEFLADDPFYNCRTNGLQISLDNTELDAAGSVPQALRLLREGKLKSLVAATFRSEGKHVVDTIMGSVTAEAGLGNWTSSAVDPVDEMNAAIELFHAKCGLLPTRCAIGFKAMIKLVKNAQFKARQKTGNVKADMDVMRGGVAADLEFKRVDLQYVDNKHGTTAAAPERKYVAGSDVLLFFAESGPTIYDASFAKTFRGGERSINAVGSFEKEDKTEPIAKPCLRPKTA